ncbi:hypothetical protein FOQG_17225, partial [Fusarium oxysporum f. sp. raphani 54005]
MQKHPGEVSKCIERVRSRIVAGNYATKYQRHKYLGH